MPSSYLQENDPQAYTFFLGKSKITKRTTASKGRPVMTSSSSPNLRRRTSSPITFTPSSTATLPAFDPTTTRATATTVTMDHTHEPRFYRSPRNQRTSGWSKAGLGPLPDHKALRIPSGSAPQSQNAFQLTMSWRSISSSQKLLLTSLVSKM